MIARRRVKPRVGRRQRFSYSPMIWVKDAAGRRSQLWGGTFPTLTEAKAAERKLLLDREAGADLKPITLTMAQLFEQYLDEKRSRVRASTLQRSLELLSLLQPLIGSMKASSLNPAHISEAYNSLLPRLSKRTVRHAHWQLHGALALAVKWGQLPANVASRVSPPEPEAFEGKAMGAEELSRLLQVIRPHPLAPLIITAIDSGARKGELTALRWSDLDLENGQLHIGRSVRRLKGGFVFSEPKTKRGRRTVVLSEPTIAVLRAHRQRQLEQRLRVGELWQDLDLIFPTRVGTPQDGNRASREFAKLAREAGVEPLRFHDLRHSSVSLLLQSGEPMADVSRRVGHATIAVTVDTYGHGLGAGGSMARTMGDILSQAIGDGTAWLATPL